MKTLKKFSVGNVSETLSDSQKKRVVGGYDSGDCGQQNLYSCYCSNGFNVILCAIDLNHAKYLMSLVTLSCSNANCTLLY